jgi:hypothetical protein
MRRVPSRDAPARAGGIGMDIEIVALFLMAAAFLTMYLLAVHYKNESDYQKLEIRALSQKIELYEIRIQTFETINKVRKELNNAKQ